MSILKLINTEPQAWCKNPTGYTRHQLLLSTLVCELEKRDLELTLPPERDGWDEGVDLILGNIAVDLKSFSLREGPRSFTWDSPFWDGKPAPRYLGAKTDYYIHPFGESLKQWKVAKAGGLRSSLYGGPPFYYKADVSTLAFFLESRFP